MDEAHGPATRAESKDDAGAASSERRPDRVALWAVLLGLFVMVAAAASAQAASSGGVGRRPPGRAGVLRRLRARDAASLKLGDCGTDVKTLNWILRNGQARAAPASSSRAAVRSDDRPRRSKPSRRGRAELQRRRRRDHPQALKQTMRRSVATWYGPGFYGNETACGRKLTTATVGVAHKRCPAAPRSRSRLRRPVRAHPGDRPRPLRQGAGPGT